MKAASFRSWPFGAATVLVPVMLAFILFEALRTFEVLAPGELAAFREGLGTSVYPKSALLYLMLATVHIFVSIGAVASSVYIIRVCRAAIAWRALAFAFVLSAGVAVAFVALSTLDLTGYRLTHGVYRDFFVGTSVESRWLNPVLFGASVLDLAILVPSVFGAISVVFAACAARAVVHNAFVERESIDTERVEAAFGWLQLLLYVLTAVLALSAFGAWVFFHIPAQMYDVGGVGLDGALKAHVTSFMDELSYFWGVIYSLTFFMAVGVPFLTAYAARHGREASGAFAPGPFSSLPKFLERVALMLSPIFVGIISKLASF